VAVAPAADHPWLSAVESLAPTVLTVFLTPPERAVLAESNAAIARAAAELPRIRRLELDAQWGTRALPPEERERLRQFVAGRGEMLGGDRFVLRALRERARARQRFALGIPLAAAGGALAVVAARTARGARRGRRHRREP
jgi:hypothetical protein